MDNKPRKRTGRRFSSGVVVALSVLAAAGADGRAWAAEDDEPQESQGAERCISPYFVVKGAAEGTERLPLKETTGTVDISGMFAHVRVNQVFANEGATPIEAIYVFPASTRAAVHGMRMRIGQRLVEARIARKKEARAEYEKARQEGKRASLLEQERANVFTMNVANIMPGDRIEVELEYSEMLVPEDAEYTFVYPAVVGPRYPGGADPGRDGWMANPTQHAGEPELYAWNVRVHLETGVPLQQVSSPSHRIQVSKPTPSSADVILQDRGGGNRDYVLRYRLAGDRIQAGLLLTPPAGANSEAFFTMVMEPPRASRPADAPPREYIFVVDVSGSMHGFPLDTAKSVVKGLWKGLRPTDSFNMVLFSGAFQVMSETGSVAASPENLAQAMTMLGRQGGGGGTELVGGLKAAYGIPRADGARSRTVVVVTDGFVGVEEEAFRMIRQRLGEANLFAFGIGSSVNRALIEGMARAGMGEPFFILGDKDSEAAASRFRAYIERPLLTGVTVAFKGFAAYDVAPAHLPDLMARRPLVLFGKYRGAPSGSVVVTGQTGQGRFQRTLPVTAELAKDGNAALRWLWARKHAEWLDDEISIGATQKDEELTALGLRYSLLTRNTSFVAVDRVVANDTGKLDQARQALPMPEGVSDSAVGGIEVEMSREEMPPGDPVLTVSAPPDARSVTAYFPFGLVKDLKLDPYSQLWQTRFLVPKDVPDGVYRVPVVIIHRDGRAEMTEGTYRIDSSEPDFELGITAVTGGVKIDVTTAEVARLVNAASVADPRLRVELRDRGDGRHFSGFLALPAGLHRVRVVVADLARNEAEHVAGCEVKR